MKYFEVVGSIDNDIGVLFGSFDRTDCLYELDAERSNYKIEGFTNLRVISRETIDRPDPKVYSNYKELIRGF